MQLSVSSDRSGAKGILYFSIRRLTGICDNYEAWTTVPRVTGKGKSNKKGG